MLSNDLQAAVKELEDTKDHLNMRGFIRGVKDLGKLI